MDPDPFDDRHPGMLFTHMNVVCNLDYACIPSQLCVIRSTLYTFVHIILHLIYYLLVYHQACVYGYS